LLSNVAEDRLELILASKRLQIKPISADDSENVLKVYRNSADFVLRISGHSPDEINRAFVENEAREAREHGARYCGISLLKSGDLVGITTFEPNNHDGDRRAAWIALLLISESFQNDGYGVETYRTLEQFIFSDAEVDRIELSVLPGNHKAQGFWESMGYRVIEPIPIPPSVIKMRKIRPQN
jgi:RimJ/RimL family protein N-acetyltransferase